MVLSRARCRKGDGPRAETCSRQTRSRLVNNGPLGFQVADNGFLQPLSTEKTDKLSSNLMVAMASRVAMTSEGRMKPPCGNSAENSTHRYA